MIYEFENIPKKSEKILDLEKIYKKIVEWLLELEKYF